VFDAVYAIWSFCRAVLIFPRDPRMASHGSLPFSHDLTDADSKTATRDQDREKLATMNDRLQGMVQATRSGSTVASQVKASCWSSNQMLASQTER
jgi:hypothetical protein